MALWGLLLGLAISKTPERSHRARVRRAIDALLGLFAADTSQFAAQSGHRHNRNTRRAQGARAVAREKNKDRVRHCGDKREQRLRLPISRKRRKEGPSVSSMWRITTHLYNNAKKMAPGPLAFPLTSVLLRNSNRQPSRICLLD